MTSFLAKPVDLVQAAFGPPHEGQKTGAMITTEDLLNHLRIIESKRIVVMGTSGSGKTTLARKLSAALGIKHVELDELHWGPDWEAVDLRLFRAKVSSATDAEFWVLDGNYGKVRDVYWPKADTVIWLDFPFHVVLGRSIFRAMRRALLRETLWAGNRESIARTFFSRDSVLLWVIQTHGRRQKDIPTLMNCRESSHLRWVRIKEPGVT